MLMRLPNYKVIKIEPDQHGNFVVGDVIFSLVDQKPTSQIDLVNVN